MRMKQLFVLYVPANFHSAEVAWAIFLDIVFEAIVRIPYDKHVQAPAFVSIFMHIVKACNINLNF